MRILLVNYMETTAPGGINKVVREIAENLAKKGHQITVLQQNPMDLAREELLDGFRLIRVGSNFDKYFYGWSPTIYMHLKKYIDAINPDIVHVHGYHTLFSFHVINAIRKIAPNSVIIFSPHLDTVSSILGGKYLLRIYHKIIGRKLFSLVDHIISCSSFEASNIRNIYNENNISIIPHGVDFMDLDNRLCKSDGINLIYAGHLIKRKCVHYIIESMDYLVHWYEQKKATLTIIGEGREKTKLVQMSYKLKLDNNIVWSPFLSREELMEKIKQADILILLSASEAYGIIVAEALAMGTPCIVSKKTALKEFIREPGCFGVDYPPDPRTVAQLILEIKKSDIKIGPFSRKIRTWDKVTKDYEILYKKSLRRRKIK